MQQRLDVLFWLHLDLGKLATSRGPKKNTNILGDAFLGGNGVGCDPT